jgi:hypothetical protein
MKYRLGRKQKRVIISEDGTQEIAFVKGQEELAQKVVDLLNKEESKRAACTTCGRTSYNDDVRKDKKYLTHLDGMMRSDMKLYEQILDTNVFAYHFNELTVLAGMSDEYRSLLRELIMRQQLAMPENAQDNEWHEEGLHPTFIPRFFLAIGIGKSTE